jgi:predicted phage gp36 major capsid-like protein
MLNGDCKQFVIGDRLGFSIELDPHLFAATNRFPTAWRRSPSAGSAVVVQNGLRYLQVA